MISSLEIKGYKSIRNQTIQLKPLNVLIGGNGVGKSNFISVFSLVRNLYEGSLQHYVVVGKQQCTTFGNYKCSKMVIKSAPILYG